MNIEFKIKTYVMWGNSIYSPDYQFVLSNGIIYTLQHWKQNTWSCAAEGRGCGIQEKNHSLRHIFKTIRKVYET